MRGRHHQHHVGGGDRAELGHVNRQLLVVETGERVWVAAHAGPCCGCSSKKQLAAGGGLGADTTFSTFTFETVRLVEEGATNTAVRDAAGSLLVGLAAASLGLAAMAAL